MPAGNSETVIAIYRVRADREEAFFDLLRRHHPTLHRLGLVTDDVPVVYRGTEEGFDGPIVFEIFTWKDGASADAAHRAPEVHEIWEGIGSLLEERDGRPSMLFPHVERRDLAADR